jgi:ABC-2 type transport system permease protein
VRATWWFLAAATVTMVGISTIAGAETHADAAGPQGEPAWQAAAVTTLPAQFALLALALLTVTSDYATGGIVPTLQWTPRRSVLFLARTVVGVAAATAAGVVIGIVASLAAYLAARPVLRLPLDEGLDVLGTVAFVVAAGACTAVGLGFLLRSTAGALIAVFLLMLVLPIMLGNLPWDWVVEIAERLPGTGAAFLLVGEVPGMTRTSAVVTLLVWAGGALLLGWLRLLRDDANR